MTPQFILKSGISDYVKEHCDGAGNYVKQVTHSDVYWDTVEYQQKRAERVLEELDWYEAYAGQEMEGKGILIADWNYVSRRTARLLEQYGFTLDWSDELVRCDDCNKAAYSSPQCYGDLSTAILMDGYALCRDCAVSNHAEELIEDVMNSPGKALKYREIDLTEYGFRKHSEKFENGFHPGQTDDPKKIYKELKTDDNDVIFVIDDVGQFDISFSAWVRSHNWNEEEED